MAEQTLGSRRVLRRMNPPAMKAELRVIWAASLILLFALVVILTPPFLGWLAEKTAPDPQLQTWERLARQAEAIALCVKESADDDLCFQPKESTNGTHDE